MSVSLNAPCDGDDDGGGGGYGGDGDDTMSEPLNAPRDAAPWCIALAPDRDLGGGPGLGAQAAAQVDDDERQSVEWSLPVAKPALRATHLHGSWAGQDREAKLHADHAHLRCLRKAGADAAPC